MIKRTKEYQIKWPPAGPGARGTILAIYRPDLNEVTMKLTRPLTADELELINSDVQELRSMYNKGHLND